MRNAAVATVRSVAGCLTEADRGVSGARGTRGKSSETWQKLAALTSEADMAWVLPGAPVRDLNSP